MKDNLNIIKKIKEILATVRVWIINDGGDVSFVEYKNNILTLKILGACVSCPHIDTTFDNGIKLIFLSELPEIKDVIFIK